MKICLPYSPLSSRAKSFLKSVSPETQNKAIQIFYEKYSCMIHMKKYLKIFSTSR
jgi:hypothetical protein